MYLIKIFVGNNKSPHLEWKFATNYYHRKQSNSIVWTYLSQISLTTDNLLYMNLS